MKITDVKTKRVHLGKITLEHMNDLKAYLQDPKVMAFFDEGVMSDNKMIQFIQEKERFYGIFENENHQLIGHFIYHPWFMIDTYEIGWVLNRTYQQKGIITELAKAVMAYAFEVDKAHRLVATCQPENLASKKVCEKLGMRLEGHFKKCIYVNRVNAWWDELFYAILEEDYHDLQVSRRR